MIGLGVLEIKMRNGEEEKVKESCQESTRLGNQKKNGTSGGKIKPLEIRNVVTLS